MIRHFLVSVALSLCVTLAFAVDRGAEIRTEMWNPADKNFNALDVPKKWMDKSAVIIAQLNRYEYKKALMANLLRHNEYRHYRIKLNDKNAINAYSEMSYETDRTDEEKGAVKVYVGFKVIKPNGKETIVDPSGAVKMERQEGGAKSSYNKLAIPGLEPGDIIDYYIAEEATMGSNGLIHFFDPVLFKLPREYPVMSHKLQFQVERRCYISLVSLNGAPQLKLVNDEAHDEKYYSLEGTNIEPVEDDRWLFPFRELPSIKFRAAYASGKAMRAFDLLLGEPGVVKSSVSKKEVEDMAGTMLSTAYDVKFFSKYFKSNLKAEKDPFEIARKCYYFYRNDFFDQSEGMVVQGYQLPTIRQLKFVDAFSTFLTSKKIDNDIVLAVSRNISSIDNLLMTNEIDWLIRVKKGDKYLYLSAFNLNTLPGEIDPLLEGTQAYSINMLRPATRDARKITLPTSTTSDNQSQTTITVDFKDPDGPQKVVVGKTLLGALKLNDQNGFMDIYDFEKEERSRFKMEESFASYGGEKKKYAALKKAYMEKRDKDRTETLKNGLETSYDLKIKNASDLKFEQSGRYLEAPALKYSFAFETDNLLKKAGPNYLIDAGKLIEKQVKIEKDELNRTTNVYFSNARALKCTITILVPTGYEVQGLDKFNMKVENKWGGFTSTAKLTGNKITIETNKHYDSFYVPKDQWNDVVAFLNASSTFGEQKILLKKQ